MNITVWSACQPQGNKARRPIRGNIIERIEELLDEGYVRLQDFDRAKELFFEASDIAGLEDFIADRGLGLVTEIEGDDFTVLAADPELAQPLISAYLQTLDAPAKAP